MQRREVLLSALTAGAVASAATAATGAVGRPKPAGSIPMVFTKDGVRLFHREWGAGRPMLFVHSWALNHTIWQYQIVALAQQGFRCIAFDRRGHGRSDLPASGYDLDTLSDDLAAVIETLDLRDIVLVGHSMGGSEIVRYLSRHGTGRVSKVVLIAPTTPFSTKTADNPYGAPQAYFDALRAEWAADFPKWIDDNKPPFFTPDTSPGMMNWIADEMRGNDLPAILACSRAFLETDLRPDLGRIDRPTLILQGDKDVSTPLEITGRRTAAGIKGAVLKVYPGAPHGIFLTHQKQVNRDILEFVRA